MKVLLLACAVSFIFFEHEVVAQSNSDAPDNYVVVIGAFGSKVNATRFVKNARKYNIEPIAELNKIRDLYYVYVLQTGDRAAAIGEVERIRNSTPYSDSWVFNGTLGDLIIAAKPVREPVVVPVEQPVVVKLPEPEPKPIPVPVQTEEEKIKEAVANKSMVLKKGETETLNFIYFFRDAAVLRPESKYEVDHLVRVLKEHPTEIIRIHGHTNGNDKGRIIKLKPNASNFFSLDETEDDYGSAVKLSELRASVIMDYLTANGIDKKRMSIKAWGGKKPLFEVDDEKAEANVRVEIEVLNY